jgi:hypothetical protein
MAETRTSPIVRRYQGSLIVGTTNAFVQGVKRATTELPTLVEGLGRAFSSRALPEAQLYEVNYGIARAAQAQVVAGWRSRLPRGSISYRPESRLTGKLGPALASPQMLEGTSARVISFVNADHLDTAAAHWYRINYGSIGPNLARGAAAEAYTVNLNNRPFIVLRDDLAPSRTNRIPAHFWIKGPVNMLIPVSKAVYQSNGTRAAHFLDLGLEAVARSFGPAYQRFFNEWVQTEAGRARLAKKDIQVVSDVRLESIGYTVTVH